MHKGPLKRMMKDDYTYAGVGKNLEGSSTSQKPRDRGEPGLQEGDFTSHLVGSSGTKGIFPRLVASRRGFRCQGRTRPSKRVCMGRRGVRLSSGPGPRGTKIRLGERGSPVFLLHSSKRR